MHSFVSLKRLGHCFGVLLCMFVCAYYVCAQMSLIMCVVSVKIIEDDIFLNHDGAIWYQLHHHYIILAN